ncbi:TPA: hypothetical protein ACF2D8_002309 [Serratia marcescens]|uniref:hypothetical protein n=1 Tax=Serratia marcescens TaxID=615 RepID=UPI000B5EFD73|nr:hypothetical protein [Serratia marcescens]ASM17945.1 hypothetical protein BVG90_14930 [Serratia marcescens]MBY4849933.1 hypothetical protein [Serratia marcescens]MCH9868044.1 hypothetical protein [Serratia marcescens]
MICLDIDAAQFLTYKFWNERAAIITALIAATALIFTIKQLRANKRESRRATAYNAYQEYLKLCFENTNFSYGKESDIIEDGGIDKKYPWFISQMLFTFEQILENDTCDFEWEISIKSQLSRHSWYLRKSKSANSNEWSTKLKKIINEVSSTANLSSSKEKAPPTNIRTENNNFNSN